MNQSTANIYVYCINFDAPGGTFYADVLHSSNLRGESVFDLVPFDENFEDYGMKDKNDTEGLGNFLKRIGVIEEDAKVLSSEEFRKYKSLIAQ